jgi:hypothetical protein
MNTPTTIRPGRSDPAPHLSDPADEEPELANEEDIISRPDPDAEGGAAEEHEAVR